MRTTNYICDVCKISKSQEDLSKILVETVGIKTNYEHFPKLEIDICKSCLEKKGFVVNPKPDQTDEEIIKKNDNNLRDKLIDILVDLDVQFYE